MLHWMGTELTFSFDFDLYESSLKPVEKADIFRYAIIYMKGGLYVDIDVTPIAPFNAWLPLYGYPNHILGI